LDFGKIHAVLDLGCGTGFLTEAAARRCGSDTRIVGVDADGTCEQPFLQRLAATGHPAQFLTAPLAEELHWPAASFDLVLASYSLCHFAGLVPAIARVLTAGGVLVALTHSERSCRDLLQASGLALSEPRPLGSIHAFSAESGAPVLAAHFANVERLDWTCRLTFDAREFDDFLTYLRAELPVILPDSEPGGDIPAPLAKSIRATLARQRTVSFEVRDAIFRCGR
jgi:ubiquinone/menaquinone biosynthesis C-methylase UbiE